VGASSRLGAVFRALDIAANVLVQVHVSVFSLGQMANSATLFFALSAGQHVAAGVADDRGRVLAWVPQNALGAINAVRVALTLLCQSLDDGCHYVILCCDPVVFRAFGCRFTQYSRVHRYPTMPAKRLMAFAAWMTAGGYVRDVGVAAERTRHDFALRVLQLP
jgi:hypothetical protein